jgi:hypothetical protein
LLFLESAAMLTPEETQAISNPEHLGPFSLLQLNFNQHRQLPAIAF